MLGQPPASFWPLTHQEFGDALLEWRCANGDKDALRLRRRGDWDRFRRSLVGGSLVGGSLVGGSLVGG